MKKLTLAEVRRIVKEELAAAPAQGAGLGKLLDDVAVQFAAKMKQQFPASADAIQKEANDLKVQLTAQIKAAAAKVKMSAGNKPS